MGLFDDMVGEPPKKTSGLFDDMQGAPKINSAAAGQKAVDDMTNNMSFGDKFIAGAGRAFNNIGLGAKQLIDGPAQFLESTFSNGTEARDSAMQTQRVIDQARIDDKALLNTGGGAVGNIAGNIVATAPAFIAAGPTAIGAGIASAGAAAFEPTSGDESRLRNVALSGALGFGTQGAINRGGDYIKGRLADMALKRSQNAPIDATIAAAQELGLKVPQSNVNPGFFTNRLESIAGKTAMEQEFSNANSAIFDAGSRRAVGLAEDAPLTSEMLQGVRDQAYQNGYEPIKKLGSIPADNIYKQTLADILDPHIQYQKAVPNAKPDPVIEAVSQYLEPDFTGNAALIAMRKIRESSKKAFAAGDTDLGQALAQTNAAIEDQVQRHLSVIDPTNIRGLLDNYLSARQLIAKTHTVEGALIEGGGTVNPNAYAKRIQAQLPMEGDLKTMGDFANNFKTSSQPYNKVRGAGVSKLDSYAGLGAGTGAAALFGPVVGGAVALGTVATPPLLRKVLGSQFIQNRTIPRNYDPTLVQRGLDAALNSDELRMAAGPTANALRDYFQSR